MQVKSAMTIKVITADREQLLPEAFSVLQEYRFHHLPVVDDKKIIGIVSDRDILRISSFEGGQVVVPSVPVTEVMSTPVVTCTPVTTIARASKLMTENRIHCLPIIQFEHFIGLVTSTDILLLLTTLDPSFVRQRLPFQYEIQNIHRLSASV